MWLAGLGLTNCHHLGWTGDQYRHPEWSPGKQLMSNRERYRLQVTPFPERSPKPIGRDPSHSRMLVAASPGGVSHHVSQSEGPMYWRHISNNFLRMPNKVRGLSSEESNSSWPFQGPRLSESELVITSPEGRGKSKGASLAREAREWRDGSESRAAAEGEGAPIPQDKAMQQRQLWKRLAFGNLKATMV